MYCLHYNEMDDIISNHHVDLRIVKVKVGDPTLIRVILSSSNRSDETHVDELKQFISQRTGQTILLEAQINIRR